MKQSQFNRRQIFAYSTASLAGICLQPSLAWAMDRADLESLIQTIIFEHCPEAQSYEVQIKEFSKKLLNRQYEGLEATNFIHEESRKFDQSKLERFVLVEFLTSETYIAICETNKK
ncbi:MAG: hypothetical protein ACOH5I_20605 [Oligoflexus sp.]